MSRSRLLQSFLMVVAISLCWAAPVWCDTPFPQGGVFLASPAPGVITAPDYTDNYVAFPSNDPFTNVYVTPDGYPVVRGADGLWTYPINQSALYHTLGWPPQVWIGAPATVLPVLVP